MLSKLLYSPSSLVFLLFPIGLSAQVASLGLGSGTAPARGSVSLALTLSGGAQPAGLQWTFNYSTADFTSMNIVAGTSAGAASKSLSCFGANGSYTCLLTGVNTATMSNGVVATATLTLSSSQSTSRAVQVSNTFASSTSGGAITSAGTGGIVSAPAADTQAPTVPGALSAVANGAQINVSWGSSTDNVGVTGYRLERCQGASCSNFAQIAAPLGTSYADTGLAAGTSYRYRARAADAAGNLSSYSSVAAATTPAGAQLSSIVCSPSTVSTSGASVCTITLSAAAPSGGASVGLVSNNALLTVPASIMIAAAATTGSFTARAGTIATDQTAVVTANYAGTTRTSSISLAASAQISALSCTPASLGSGNTATCTVTLTKGAPAGGALVTVSDNNSILTVPASITVAATATTGTFTATAGTVTSNQTVIVTASFAGSSRTSTVSLVATSTVLSIWSSTSSPAVSSANDTAAVDLGVKFRSTVAGYVTGVRFYKGSQNTGTHTGSLWSSSGALLARVTFTNESSSGWQQALFSTAVAINAGTTYVVSYRAPNGRYAINTGYFSANGVTNNTLRALKDGESGGNGVFRYGSSSQFPNSTWQSSNYWVDVVFTAQQSSVLRDTPSEEAISSTSFSSEANTSSPTMANRKLSGSALSCSPRIVQAGQSFTCSLRLDEDRSSSTDAIAVAASGTDARLPAYVTARAGQRSIDFHGSIDKAASQSLVLISTGEGGFQAQDQIMVLPDRGPALSQPDVIYARIGDQVAFTVAARDGGDLPVSVSASDLPLRAAFEAASKHFEWTPTSGQEGEYTVTFTAVNQGRASSSGKTRIVVSSGKPEVTEPTGMACVPGSVAILHGRWLGLNDELISDPSGASQELGGTIIRANGSSIPILSVSPTRVAFLCPNNLSGREMSLVLETAQGLSAPLLVALAEAKPTLVSVEGSGTDGFITRAGTDRIAVTRDVRGLGEPAQAEDLIVVHATGLGALGALGAEAGSMIVRIGNTEAKIESVSSHPSAAGISQIFVRIPVVAGRGDAIPVQMTMRSSAGQTMNSNVVTMAIE